MIIKSIFLFIFLCFSDTNAAKFRFDYTYSKPADGWLNLHIVPATWSDARLICHAEGAVLASPLTQQLRDAILDYVKQNSSVYTIFTGVHTTFSKGVYASIEGVPLTRLPINWTLGEPNNFENSESCLVMLIPSNGTMADVTCTDVFPFVCYKKTQTLVVTGCGTHDPEYNLEKRTGSCYKFHRRGLSWSQAYMTCMAEGAHLAIINSELEAVALKELYASHPDNVISAKYVNFAGIGALDSRDGGSWMTIHGETLKEAGFDQWHPGQPDNITQPGGEFCLCISKSHGKLCDYACDWTVPFICEKKPESLEASEE